MKGKYKTGGKKVPSGLSKYESKPGKACDPTYSGAGMGTGYGQTAPDKNKSGAGGYGSSGTRSNSSSRGM